MAVLPGVPALRVTVCVQGAALQEYTDPHGQQDPETTVVKYIEAEANANFSIDVELDDHIFDWNSRYVKVLLRIDNHFIGGIIIPHRTRQEEANGTNIQPSIWSDKTQLFHRPVFTFKALDVVDREDAPQDEVDRDKEAAGSLGNIEVALRRVIREGPRLHPSSTKEWHFERRELLAKALEDTRLTHPSECSMGQERDMPRLAKFVPASKANREPFATFQFHYRSRESLQRSLIMPMLLPLARLSRAEIERYALMGLEASHQRANIKERRAVKQEPTIKREPAVKQEEMGDASEPIDLTDD